MRDIQFFGPPLRRRKIETEELKQLEPGKQEEKS